MTQPEYRSPRKIEEEMHQYKLDRFEAYMKLSDEGVLERALAITAFSEELDSGIWYNAEAA